MKREPRGFSNCTFPPRQPLNLESHCRISLLPDIKTPCKVLERSSVPSKLVWDWRKYLQLGEWGTSPGKRNLTLTVFTHQLWPETLTCRSIYDERALKDMFVEIIQASIWKTLKHWWAVHQDASLEDLTLEVASLPGLQIHKAQR